MPEKINCDMAQPHPGKSSDFSRIAGRYDATRSLPSQYLKACYARLSKSGLLPSQGVILDAGCGTGQVSVPLAELGYQILGVDISAEMIAISQSKLPGHSPSVYQVADVCNLPYPDASFDAVIVSKLFQHVENWQDACRELVRVVKPGNCIFQINEKGAFSNSVRRHFSRRADELGFSSRFLGINPHAQESITDLMLSLGCKVSSPDMSDLKWEIDITYGDALGWIKDGLFAEFWYLPPAIHDQLVAETAEWVQNQPRGAQTVERLAPYLVVEAFCTPA